MKVAITVWGNRISPVFDSAQTILLAHVIDEKIVDQRREFIPITKPSALARTLIQLQIDTLICGAISEEPAFIIEKAGISLLPFVTGNAEQVLTYFSRNLPVSKFAMPGCRSVCRFQHNSKLSRKPRCCEQEKQIQGRQYNAMAKKGFDWTEKTGQGE